MRVIINAQFLLASALYIAQIMQIYGDYLVDVKYDYEILEMNEYISLEEKEDKSHGNAVINCDFEGDSWCGFQNDKSQGDFDWTLTSKRTPSYGTGPSHDVSGAGSYLYIETSYPRRNFDKARLTSPVISPMVYCLQFGLHAWGEDIGELTVYKNGLSGNTREKILRFEKSRGRNWHFVFLTVAHTSRFVIEFEGVRGKGFRGDIALDNIILTEGECPIIRPNNTGICGAGYPGFTNTIPGFPAYYSWPWLVWLTSSDIHSQPSCPAVQVSSNWLLTTRDCARRFSSHALTAYAVKKKKRRNALKIAQRFTKTVQPVLLKVNNSTSKKATVCLPASVQLQNRVTNCYLLGLSMLGHQKSFVEIPAIILSTKECKREIRMSSKANLNAAWLLYGLCVRVNSSFSFNVSHFNFGYLICKNKIMNKWILHGMSLLSESDFKQNVLVLRRVSFDVDWIENITKESYKARGPPQHDMPTTTQNPLLTQGFQIMEKESKKCVSLNKGNLKFTYTRCNNLDLTQRFKWTQDYQLVLLFSNTCIESDGTHMHFLRTNQCNARRRSQLWTCKGNTIMNYYYNRYISSKPHDSLGLVRMTRLRTDIGNFVIFGTAHDNLCSLRPTVKGIMTCDFGLHRTCGFDGTDSSAQLMWIISRNRSDDYLLFPGLKQTGNTTEDDNFEKRVCELPGLVKTGSITKDRNVTVRDKFFRVTPRTNRGTPKAVLRSRPFHGQQCAEFWVIFQGSSNNQLNVYKDGDGEGKLMYQKNAASDNRWRFHRVTLVPSACEAFQVVFEAVLANFTQSKVAIRDIVISPGACRTVKTLTDGECPKDWKLVNGQCVYFHNTKLTWHEASAVCRIGDAELITHNAEVQIIPRGRLAWFGVRSCPTGKLYSVDGVPHNHKTLFTTPACMFVERPGHGAPFYQTSDCDLKLSFACQKDPKTTRGTCGWRNVSAPNDRQFPWHVLIIARNHCECGGTLIAPGLLVTSTLCLSRVWLPSILLIFPSSRKQSHRIREIINHPLSGIKSGDNDVSIVVFKDDPSFHYACLMQTLPRWSSDSDNFLKDKKCVVFGWGTFKGSYRSCSSKNYQIHEVELVGRQECREYYGEHMITDSMICAKSRNETSTNCLGDTGGPLVCEVAGMWTLVGVTSWGIGCSPTRKYGVFTDVGSMKPWIDAVLREKRYQ